MNEYTANPSRHALVAALASARATVASLEAALVEAERAETEPAEGRLLSLTAAAEASGLPESTLRRWCRSGQLRHSLGPRRAYLVALGDVRQALAAPRPARPLRKALPKALDDDESLDPLEAALARGELEAGDGR